MTTPSNAEALNEGDKIYIKASQTADVRLAPLSALKSYLDDYFSTLASSETKYQYESPAGPTQIQLQGENNIHLILTPPVDPLYLAVVSPIGPPLNGREIIVTTSTIVSTIQFAYGEDTRPSLYPESFSLAAGGFFTMKYDGFLNTWNRIR